MRVLNLAIGAMTLAGIAMVGAFAPPGARAAIHDGNWTVLIITETGNCDRGYRYDVAVADGQVRYRGDAKVNLSGTVQPSGAVKVNIRMGEQGADGTGKLGATSGAGTWRGAGGSGQCAGRWEAERR